MRRSHLLVLAGTGLLIGSVALAAPLYRWVDEEGKVHYGDRPPPEQKTEELQLKFVGKGRPKAPLEEADAESDPARERVEPVSPELRKPSPEHCAAARRRLQLYANARRLERPGEDGQPVVVAGAEREKYIAEARKEVERACASQ